MSRNPQNHSKCVKNLVFVSCIKLFYSFNFFYSSIQKHAPPGAITQICSFVTVQAADLTWNEIHFLTFGKIFQLLNVHDLKYGKEYLTMLGAGGDLSALLEMSLIQCKPMGKILYCLRWDFICSIVSGHWRKKSSPGWSPPM